MTDQKQSYKAEGKWTGVHIHPDNLVIVGIDCDEAARPELADPERIRLPIDPALVASIARHGVRQPISIKKFHGDDNVYVVAGRRRVLHAREANKIAGGDAPVLIPCVPDKSSDVLASLVIENEFRVNNTPLMKAHQAERMIARGYVASKVADTYGVSVSTVANWRALLATPPAVQQAVEANQITAVVAVEIGKLAPAEQDAALATAIESGRGGETLERVKLMRKPRGNGEDDDKPRRLSVAQMKRFAAVVAPEDGHDGSHAQDDDLRFAHSLLRAMLGEGPQALKDYPAVVKALRRALKPEEGQ